MIRNLVAAGVFLTLCAGLVVAEEFGARISKVEGNKVTFTKMKKGEKGEKAEKGEEMTLPAAADVKVMSAKFNFKEKKVEPGEALEGGLKNERFQSDKGVNARITTDDGKITEIQVFPQRKKKGN